jgi:hypothetical protein
MKKQASVILLILTIACVFLPLIQQTRGQTQPTLTVISPHGSPSPSVGSRPYVSGTSVTCSVTSQVIEGGITYTCVSWSGTGSVSSSGWGSSTDFIITQDSTIFWNWVASSGDLLQLPVAGYSYLNSVQEGEGLSHGHLNSVSQVVTVNPGQRVSLEINYQIFAPSNAGEIDQLFFVESWTPAWPPIGYTVPVYNGVPGTNPGVTDTETISLDAPSTSGTYYLWLCFDSQYSMEAAVNHRASSMVGLPAHVKIIVLGSTSITPLIVSVAAIGVVSISIAGIVVFLLKKRKAKTPQKDTHQVPTLQKNLGNVVKVAYDVFISYSAKDKQIADALCATLESRRIRCWIAPRDVRPGTDYPAALIQALNNSRLLVLVFSKEANTSSQVMREVERAVAKGIPIIPLRVENVEPSESMEFLLCTPHWLDAMTPPLEKHLQKLADTVQLILDNKDEKTQTARNQK